MVDEIKKSEECHSVDNCHGDTEECQKDPAMCFASSPALSGITTDNGDDCLGKSLDQLSKAFMASARRWEMIVYPALFAFIVLSVYGFFLIYSLTKDVGLVAEEMVKINNSMGQIVVQMDSVSRNMVVMTQTIDSQSLSMKEMVHHMRGMNMSMNQMRYDMSVMNNSVSRPMSFMNTFMPW